LHAESREVVVRGAGRHHLERAAREAERRRKHGVATAPPHDVLEPSGQEVVRNRVQTHLLPTCSGDRPSVPHHAPCSSPSLAAFGSTTACLRRRIAPGNFSMVSFTGPHSSAPTDSRYANGTSNTKTNTVMATRPNGPRPRNTTENGYRNTISTSRTMKLIATR